MGIINPETLVKHAADDSVRGNRFRQELFMAVQRSQEYDYTTDAYKGAKLAQFDIKTGTQTGWSPLIPWKTISGQVVLDRETALKTYEQVRKSVIATGKLTGKYLRPWVWNDGWKDNMDRSEPWLGFEFELGFKSYNERAEVIGHAWDTWEGVTFDREGEGDFPSEITFTPAELSKFEDGTAPAAQFMQRIADNKIGAKGEATGIGTHVNISLPDLTQRNLSRVVRGLNGTLAALPQTVDGKNVREEMFGRSQLYGGFFYRGEYTEGKLFRTTYSMEQFQKYVKVSKLLIKAAQALIKAGIGETDAALVVNLWEMYTGAEEEPTVVNLDPANRYNSTYEINQGVFSGLRNKYITDFSDYVPTAQAA